MVVPGESIPIESRPGKGRNREQENADGRDRIDVCICLAAGIDEKLTPQQHQQPGNQHCQVADQRLTPAQRCTIHAYRPQFPGAHADGLSAVSPEATEESKAHGQQPKLIEQLHARVMGIKGFKSHAMREGHDEESAQNPDGQQDDRVV